MAAVGSQAAQGGQTVFSRPSFPLFSKSLPAADFDVDLPPAFADASAGQA